MLCKGRPRLHKLSGCRAKIAMCRGGGTEVVEERLQELRSLRTRDLKKQLEAMGIATDGCVDKDSLLERLDATGTSALQGTGASGATAAPVEAEVVDTTTSDFQLDASAAAHLDELRAMKTRDLRAALQSLGVRTQGCVERADFLRLLETQGAAALAQGQRADVSAVPAKGRRKKRRGGKKPAGFAGASGEPASGNANDPLKAEPSPEYPPPAKPKRGQEKIRIARMVGTDQHGLRAGETRVLALDLELGAGATPCRFVLDTVTYHSVIKAEVAKNLGATVIGPPKWANAVEGQDFGLNQVRFMAGWLGNLELGEIEMASVEGELPVPMGACGILGLDFLKLFDWDIDVKGEKAEVATVPRDLKGPVPFDLENMHVASLMKVRLPTGMDLLASPIQVRLPGSGEEVDVMGIADLGAACSICNMATLDKLGVGGVAGAIGGGEAAAEDGEAARPSQTVPERPLEFVLGKDGPEGPVITEATAATGNVEVFDTLGLASNWPCAILGPDVLCRSRLILSPRLNSIWLSQ